MNLPMPTRHATGRQAAVPPSLCFQATQRALASQRTGTHHAYVGFYLLVQFASKVLKLAVAQSPHTVGSASSVVHLEYWAAWHWSTKAAAPASLIQRRLVWIRVRICKEQLEAHCRPDVVRNKEHRQA